MAYAGLFGLNASQGSALPAFVLEGRRLMLLRQTPVSMRAVLWAKFWAAYLPTLLAWALVLAAYGAFLRLAAWQVAALVLVTAVGLVGLCAIMVPIGALGADFAVTEARPKLAGPATALSWLGLLLGAGWQAGVLALSLWLILALGQTTELVTLTRAALRALPPLGRMFAASNAWVPGLAAAGCVGLAFIASRLWAAAQRRLETWEPAQA
jgi:hypothetical protein